MAFCTFISDQYVQSMVSSSQLYDVVLSFSEGSNLRQMSWRSAEPRMRGNDMTRVMRAKMVPQASKDADKR